MNTWLKIAAMLVGLVCLPAAQAGDKPKVALETTLGKVVLELEPGAAPKTVENFLAYVDSGFYDGSIFHRVIPGFVAQGGGLTPDMQPKPTRQPVSNEAKNGLKNVVGSIAMARTNDPHSATSQFFINLRANESLDHPSFDGWGYAVFGRVIEGMDVVKRISEVKTGLKAGQTDVPDTPIVIKRAHRLKAASANKP